MFYGQFKSANDVFERFDVKAEDREGVVFLFAQYETPDYEGYAGVIFLKNGRLYTAQGSHCSCYGLEDQWKPEEISLAVVRHYIDNDAGPYGINYKLMKPIIDQFDNLDTDVLTDEQVAMLLRLSY